MHRMSRYLLNQGEFETLNCAGIGLGIYVVMHAPEERPYRVQKRYFIGVRVHVCVCLCVCVCVKACVRGWWVV
jgi:hypothetical protein